MSDISLRVFNLGKRYRLSHSEHYRMLRDTLVSVATAPMRIARRVVSGKSPVDSSKYLWALRDISFDVKKGECIGIIGRNGAGKSTLLKVLSRITDPTEGGADLYGRVGSLLEVGSGFHQEMSGRENIYMNGALLGMRKHEIDRKFDQIVEFAEVADFIDTPVKRYSSGMYMRLAFAVAAHMEPEILVIDEVLAVGDAAFQKKCLGKMGDIASHGRTVLFVSHNMAAVQSLCSRAVMLEQGRVIDFGETESVVGKYLDSVAAIDATPLVDRKDRGGDGSTRILSLRVESAEGPGVIRTASRLKLTFTYEGERPLQYPAFMARLNDVNNVGIYQFDSEATGGLPETLPAKGVVTCITDPLNITPGRCYLNVGLLRGGAPADIVEYAAAIDVEQEDFYGSGRMPSQSEAVCVLRHAWTAG